jgi:hypothetical protein
MEPCTDPTPVSVSGQLHKLRQWDPPIVGTQLPLGILIEEVHKKLRFKHCLSAYYLLIQDMHTGMPLQHFRYSRTVLRQFQLLIHRKLLQPCSGRQLHGIFRTTEPESVRWLLQIRNAPRAGAVNLKAPLEAHPYQELARMDHASIHTAELTAIRGNATLY